MLLAALLFLQAATVMRHPTPIVVADQPVTITFQAARAKSQLVRAAKSRSSTVVLKVDGVTAEKAPGFIAAVFVGNERVGEVSLYEYRHPQTFTFEADAAVAKALRKGSSIPICFRPESGLEGQPARVQAPIRIAAVSLLIERK